jgi:GMP synthase (glutamine-hydrolysing)
MDDKLKGGIAVLDFGGQYTHLICRRIRGAGVYASILPYDTPLQGIRDSGVAGIVLSGGPASVYSEHAPRPDPRIFSDGLPLLGICYGYQLLVEAHGGSVKRTSRREYGRSQLKIKNRAGIFRGLNHKVLDCWMSHTDTAVDLPKGFVSLATSQGSPYAAVSSSDGRQLGVQFHPEVSHTQDGDLILRNFVLDICGAKRSWKMGRFVERTVLDLKRSIDGNALCAVSGGVDSTVAASLVRKAIGARLTCIFVDHGLLRAGEENEVPQILASSLDLKVERIEAKERFLSALKGIRDPEEKRKRIGATFGDMFREFSSRHGPFEYLVQGTLYPDVVESGRASHESAIIKTHHNVGGLPRDLGLEVVEPLRDLYKDEVRRVAKILHLPNSLIKRHPFPGPGLAVRIIGEVTEEKLDICRRCNLIVEEVLRERGVYDKVWQAFAFLGDDKVTGVQGDERRLGHHVTVKVVESSDAMTADWSRLPSGVIDRMSTRITNEVEGVVSVAYSVSSKPPATIEPQ